VTGSRYYLDAGGTTLLVDCGMFQEREYLDRNWETNGPPPREIDAVILTHAHLDHSGLLPKLVRDGFRGPIYTTRASADVAELILYDSAGIQEEDVAFKKKRHGKEGRKGCHPEVPLYTTRDVDRTLPRLEPAAYDEPIRISDSVQLRLHDAGHILGSALAEFEVQEQGRRRRVLFSGDLGQFNMPILRDPTTVPQADYVVMESTYGDRDHPQNGGIQAQLESVIRQTVEAGGNVVIPVFAVERAQELVYHLAKLHGDGRLPAIPVFLDSPMAVDVTELFRRHRECLDEEMQQMLRAGRAPLRFPGLSFTRTTEESKRINDLKRPAVIMATSGMCTAGRIKHHLVHNLTRPECTVLFVGFQVRGTLGRQILDGNQEVRIHGRTWRVRARIRQIQGFSGHADHAGLLRWLGGFRAPPRHLFLTHGEEQTSLKLAQELANGQGWGVTVPRYRESVELE
jgi:metallo-beta-lactamase family protein